MSVSLLLSYGTVASGPTSTWNPSDKDADITLSNSDLTASINAAHGMVRGTLGRASGSGVYMYELVFQTDAISLAGLANSSATLSFFPGVDANGWAYFGVSGEKYTNSVATAWGATLNTSGDVLGVVWDAAAGSISFYKNGTLQGGGAAFTGISGTLYPAWGPGSGANPHACTINTGATAFTYPISGASAWG